MRRGLFAGAAGGGMPQVETRAAIGRCGWLAALSGRGTAGPDMIGGRVCWLWLAGCRGLGRGNEAKSGSSESHALLLHLGRGASSPRAGHCWGSQESRCTRRRPRSLAGASLCSIAVQHTRPPQLSRGRCQSRRSFHRHALRPLPEPGRHRPQRLSMPCPNPEHLSRALGNDINSEMRLALRSSKLGILSTVARDPGMRHLLISCGVSTTWHLHC
ncbi:hypothetical protein CC78DRAFT_606824 [Lojkania enalia]|uniref:Uncharacterized protein n=1 Tax=Lojkania enalia TaxID=147567 RepID=A0A9P4N8F6_9PLEO|nr:hypothetical protein CC78DRAFT_606824 [Didymosphaeria enalia]